MYKRSLYITLPLIQYSSLITIIQQVHGATVCIYILWLTTQPALNVAITVSVLLYLATQLQCDYSRIFPQSFSFHKIYQYNFVQYHLPHPAVVQYVYTISYAKPCTSINIFTGVYWTTAGEVPAVIVPIGQNIIWYNNSTLIAMETL